MKKMKDVRKTEEVLKNQKKYRNPLSRHILIGGSIFTLVLCIAMSMVGFAIFQNRMMSQYESHIRDIMNLTMARIDVEDLEECMETGIPSEEFKELLEFLDQARQNYSLEYLVIVKPIKNGNRYDVMAVASGLLPEERNGANKKDLAVPQLGDMTGDYYPPDFIPVIYDDMLNRYDIKFSTSGTEFGKTYDGATSIRNGKGEGIALLTAGFTLQFIESTMAYYAIVSLFCAVILSILFLTFMIFWLQKRIIIPLKKIEKTAGEFVERSHAKKDPEALVLTNPDIHTGDELESLADTLVSMSEDMKRYVEDLLVSAVEMEDMREEITKINNLAHEDALTGVRNKTAYDKAKNRLDWDIVNQIANFGILMIDLNYLKRINDTFGHDHGDDYIRNMCGMICDVFAHSPVFRIGGDEFVVILENRDLESSEALINRLKNQMEKLQSDKRLEAWERLSAAMGLAVYDSKIDENADSVLKRADKAMYEHKKAMKAVREG